MKQPKDTKRIQTELFFDRRLVSGPILLEMPAARRVELESLVAELLLNVALENAELPKGDECDE
jgi:hypothetical protein